MRDDSARVNDILEMCDRVIDQIGRDHERFTTDQLVQAAAQRWLEIIGEAAAGLSEEFRTTHPEVAWRDLIGMRNILAHGYFHVDLDIVWVAITRDVPHLRDRLS